MAKTFTVGWLYPDLMNIYGDRGNIIALSRRAQWRPCRLEAGPLKYIDGWLETYRRLWNERLDRLDAYLQELQAQDAKKAHGKDEKRGRKK